MIKNRILVYFKKEPLKDRFFFGDRFLKKLRNYILPRKMGSLELVFLNLCKGFEKLNIGYKTNLPFHKIKPTDYIVVLGTGKEVLKGYQQPNKIIAGIGLMTHPAQWPTLFNDYPVVAYLQHSTWTSKIYNHYFGNNSCKIWPVGIDTDFWKPKSNVTKSHLLIYIKFLWDRERNTENLLHPILAYLTAHQINYQVITYGSYQLKDYKELLAESIGMIFLCEHESQGIAYQEAMCMNVPIFAWDMGKWIDPNRLEWGEKEVVEASSVPYFDSLCGDKFQNLSEFENNFESFYAKALNNEYHPRNYVIENLSLEKSTSRMLDIIREVYHYNLSNI